MTARKKTSEAKTDTTTTATSTSTIQNEEQFQEAIMEANASRQSGRHEAQFQEIGSKIHEYLGKQDSEATLSLITR